MSTELRKENVKEVKDVEKMEERVCSKEYIPVVTKNYSVKVKTDTILLIERDNRRLKIKSDKGDYCFYAKIEDVERFLTDSFYRCLKGCYINLEKVDTMANQLVVFDNGFEYQLGRNNYIKTRKCYSRYIKGEGLYKDRK